MLTVAVRMFCFLILVTGLLNTRDPELKTASSFNIRYDDRTFSSNRIIVTSPGLFSIMNFELISPDRIMTGHPEGVVLPMRTKTRMFGENPALGKVIYVDSEPLQVVGIIKDIREKSCLWCDLIILRNELEMSDSELINIRCLMI